MIGGAVVGFGDHADDLVSGWARMPARAVIGGTLLNMAVFAAMCSYVLQAVSFILLRHGAPAYRAALRQPVRHPRRGGDDRSWRLITIGFQFLDPVYRQGVCWRGDLVRGRHRLFRDFRADRLVLSPEEEFALTKGSADYKTH